MRWKSGLRRALGSVLSGFQLLASLFRLLLHAFLQAALAFGQLRLRDRRAVIGASEAGKRDLDGVRRAAEVDGGEDHLATLLERRDHGIRQRNFGRALVGKANGVVELLALAAVDLHHHTRRNETRGRNGNLQQLAVDLAFNGDQADCRNHLAILGENHVLHDADIVVFLLGAGLEPAERRSASAALGSRGSILRLRDGRSGNCAERKDQSGQSRPGECVCLVHHKSSVS
ncbi:hypothetical protein AT6N2_C0488 [Agrobacterium tumefaciens]|nr:hypothetical protein AT6N2_C0488 [Agrobacterium tumefaciens]